MTTNFCINPTMNNKEVSTMENNSILDALSTVNDYMSGDIKDVNKVEKTSKYDVAAIMRRAWEIAHKCKAEGLTPVFGICLNMAWMEAKSGSPSDIIAQWNAMDDTKQINVVTACFKKTCKEVIGRSTEDKYNGVNDKWLWECLRGTSLEELQNACFVYVLDRMNIEWITRSNERRAKKGMRDVTFISVIYSACKAAMTKFYRNEISHVKAELPETMKQAGSGETFSLFDIKGTTDDKLEAIPFNETVNQFMDKLEGIDKEIFRKLAQGMTERVISEQVGKSKTAVHARIERMRKELAKVLAA